MNTINVSQGNELVEKVTTSSKTELDVDAKTSKHALARKTWIKIWILSFITLLVVGILSRNLILGTPVEAYTTISGEIRQTVVASGRVITPQRVSVASDVIGRVNTIPVAEGENVVRGQILIQLDNQDELANLAQAESGIDQSKAKLQQQREVALPAAIEGLKKAEADVKQLQKQFARMEELKQRNFVSQMQVDDARRNLDVALVQKHTAALQVQTNQANGGDSALAVAGLAQSMANSRASQVKLDQNAIRAPSDGILIARNIEPGDIVQPGASLMTLAVTGDIQIEIQVDEKNLAKLALGQKALGSADAFPDRNFEAVVDYINPGIDAARGSVMIKLRVIAPPDYLRQDMTVSVDIVTAHRIAALVVPSEAVRDATGDRPWVLVVRDNRTVRQEVGIGLRGDNQTEITRGLTSKEPVILSSVGTVGVGQRVRVRIVPRQ